MPLETMVGLRRLNHQGREDAHAVDHAPQVDADAPFPVGLGVFPQEPAGAAHAGVVEHEAGHAETRDTGVSQQPHRRRLRHVRLDGEHLRARMFEFGAHRFQRVLLHISDHHVHAALVRKQCKFAPEAAAAAGDDCCPACEDFQDFSP